MVWQCAVWPLDETVPSSTDVPQQNFSRDLYDIKKLQLLSKRKKISSKPSLPGSLISREGDSNGGPSVRHPWSLSGPRFSETLGPSLGVGIGMASRVSVSRRDRLGRYREHVGAGLRQVGRDASFPRAVEATHPTACSRCTHTSCQVASAGRLQGYSRDDGVSRRDCSGGPKTGKCRRAGGDGAKSTRDEREIRQTG